MIRPAERFAVNVIRHEPTIRLDRRPSILSLPLVIGLAAVLGAGLGGMLPARWTQRAAPLPLAASEVSSLAEIEPAAGPAADLVISRAPDRGFYAPVLLDRVPFTMRLEPQSATSSLSLGDARRLAPDAAGAIRVDELALAGSRVGPVRLAVSGDNGPVSVLGSDLLDRIVAATVDGDRLRLAPR